MDEITKGTYIDREKTPRSIPILHAVDRSTNIKTEKRPLYNHPEIIDDFDNSHPCLVQGIEAKLE